MDLSPGSIREQLVHVDVHGWDSWPGRALLEQVRSGIVEPIVRRSGLTGAVADQALASGWAAAWDAMRRPSVRCAENPAGLVWVAVRRAVWVEVTQWRSGPDRNLAESMLHEVPDESASGGPCSGQLGPSLGCIVDVLVDLGWERAALVDAIEELAAHATRTGSGDPQVRWRWAALRVGLPEWQARRLASALLGVSGHPGVLAMVVRDGPGVLEDSGIRRVLRATCHQGLATPSAHLSSWAEQVPATVPPESGRRERGQPERGQPERGQPERGQRASATGVVTPPHRANGDSAWKRSA